MRMKTILSILCGSVLISCANLGEEYVTIRLPHGENEKVVKISEVQWSKKVNGWHTSGWCITNLEDAKKVDAYKNQ